MITILIPPSEGKTSGGTQAPLKTVHPITKQLLKELNNYENQEKLLGVKGKKLQESIQTNKNVLEAKTLPAIERYSGVVYNGIDYSTLKNKKLFDTKIRIVSALFGLVQPQQLIPDYKLKIDKLQAAKKWKEENSKQLKGKFVIDLLPQAQKKAISYDEGIEVEFVIIKKNKKIPAGHNGKLIKGRFIRFLVENNITSSKDITKHFEKFKEDGFEWNGKEFVKEV